MKGQANLGIGLVLTAAILIVGVYSFFIIADAVPHEETYINETLLTGTQPTNGSTYLLDYTPIRAASDVLVSRGNDSALLTGGGSDYSVSLGNSGIKIHNSSAFDATNTTVTYVTNPLGTSGQNTYTEINNITYSGFELAAVTVIIIAAVAVLGGLFLLGGRRD